MPPSTHDRLSDIIDMATRIDRLTRDMSGDDFANNETVRAATERYLGIACEASLRLPADLKQAGSDIDWRAMNDFANILRHGYHTVDASQVWNIVRNHLPALRVFAQAARLHRS